MVFFDVGWGSTFKNRTKAASSRQQLSPKIGETQIIIMY